MLLSILAQYMFLYLYNVRIQAYTIFYILFSFMLFMAENVITMTDGNGLIKNHFLFA